MRSGNWWMTVSLAASLGGCGPGWALGMAVQDTGEIWSRDTVTADPCRDKADDGRRACVSACDLKLNRACVGSCDAAHNKAIAACEGRTLDASASAEAPPAKQAAPAPPIAPDPSPRIRMPVH